MREVLGLSLIPTVSLVALPTAFLFMFGGAESQANLIKFFYYGIMGYSAVIAGVMVRLLQSEGFFSRNPDLYPFSRMTAHSPRNTVIVQTLEDVGGIGGGVAKAIKNPGTFMIIWLIIGLIFGTLVGVSGTFVAGTPDLVQGQVTETAQLGLAVEPAVMAETLFIFMFLFYIVVGAVGWIGMNRLGLGKFWSIVLGKGVAVPFIAFFNTGYHWLRYGLAEAKVFNVFMQGMMYASTVSLFDSIIPAWFIHASGNFYDKLISLGIFTSEAMIALTLVLGLVSVLLLSWVANPFNILGRQ